MTLTKSQQKAIRRVLDGMEIAGDLGTRESACSVAAINLGLTGELTDDIPACMSEVIGACIIVLQDHMPAGMRNSNEWRALLIPAAGTGRNWESERLEVILDWMLKTSLTPMQDAAGGAGIGAKWRRMCEERTQCAAKSAERAAESVGLKNFAESACRASVAFDASKQHYHRSWAAAWVAVWAARHAAKVFNRPDFWHDLDPIGLLWRLVEEGR